MRNCLPMPFVVRSDSENEAELVFLSPDEEAPSPQERGQPSDQGASPVLRRSNRKRKSVTAYSESDMSRGSGSKKKKSSPSKDMPKTSRTPAKDGQAAAAQAEVPKQPTELEALLLAMEGRLSAKIDKANEAAKEAVTLSKLTNEGLGELEVRVEEVETAMKSSLKEAVKSGIKEAEERIMQGVEDKVKGMVGDQLRMMGFDQDLSAADLTVRSSVRQADSYASALSVGTGTGSSTLTDSRLSAQSKSKEDKREDRFWLARRSLRMWPVQDPSREGVITFLKDRLRMDADFIEEELGLVAVRKVRDPRSKLKHEVVVEFETKQVRDSVKAKAVNLAGSNDECGVRLELPVHLQKDFRLLMNLAYDMKQKNKDLKRNVKFDEDDMGLYMDVQLGKDTRWRRVKPEQAGVMAKKRKRRGPDMLDNDELMSLVGSSSEGD